MEWYFDSKSFTKYAIYNEYLSLYFSFNFGVNNVPIKYGLLIKNNTIKLHSCIVNGNEYDKSYLIISYR